MNEKVEKPRLRHSCVRMDEAQVRSKRTEFVCAVCKKTADYNTKNLGSRWVLCDGKPRIDNWRTVPK